jgi:hypothetical protein
MAYGTVTVAAMLEKVRRLLGEQTDSVGAYPSSVWTDQFLVDGMNQGMDRITRDGFWFHVKKDVTLTTVSGTNRYALPDAIQAVTSLYLGTPGAGLELVPMAKTDFDNLVSGAAYAIENDDTEAYIYLYPTPTSAQTITIYGIARQAQLSSASSSATTNLPDQYAMFLVWSAVAYAHGRQEELELEAWAQRKADDIYFDIWRNEIAPGGRQGIFMQWPQDQLR